MRTRILRALAAVALAVGVGTTAVVATQASADTTPPAAAAEVLSTTERGLCVKIGTGAPQSLWLVAATHRCPSGFWGPATLKQAFGEAALAGIGGAVGPKGDKGDPGDSVAKVVTKNVTLTPDSPTTQVVTLTGLPAKSSAVAELVVTNAGEAPSGTVVVTGPAAAAGSTERAFTVKQTLIAGQTFTLAIKVLAVSA